MRVNVYAEEMTDRIEIVKKEVGGEDFTGLRFYLELPATVNGRQYRGPFIHQPGDDDSAAVTFWGKRDLRIALRHAIEILDEHYGDQDSDTSLKATIAVSAVLARIQRDPRVAYYFDPLTDCMEKLIAAHCAMNGLDEVEFRATFVEKLVFEAPRGTDS